MSDELQFVDRWYEASNQAMDQIEQWRTLMSHLDYKPFSKRHRPHIEPIGAILFVTYRLAGSIPKATVRTYRAKRDWLETEVRRVCDIAEANDTPEAKEWLQRVSSFEREWFIKFEDILHEERAGPMWLKDERIAKAVVNGLHKLDGESYRLDAYSIMSNHVHVVFRPLLSELELQESFDQHGHLVFTSEHPGLSRIMQLLKGRSARQCNELLSRTGQFWEHENFDRVIRSEKFNATIRYVLNNPVKAGIVSDWRQWRWNYCRREIASQFQGE